MRVQVDADDRDKHEVRDAGPARRLQEAARPFDVYLARLGGTRGAVDYRAYAIHGLLQPLPREQVPPDRAGVPAVAEYPRAGSGSTQTVHYQPAERARPTRNQNL